ncbi:MAG: hypothetical protein LBJ08_02255, partial [Bifidobacteriaceae bacterium]|nr:hypothetical protein [Bifidobacteriaceae bacterium]
MRIDVVSIFPEYLDVLKVSLLGKAIESGILDIHVHDLRKWTHDVHRSVDDAPYGGGAGMVMTAPVWGEALDALLGQGEGHLGGEVAGGSGAGDGPWVGLGVPDGGVGRGGVGRGGPVDGGGEVAGGGGPWVGLRGSGGGVGGAGV